MKELIKSYQIFSKSLLRSYLIKERLNMSHDEVKIKCKDLTKIFLDNIRFDDSIKSVALYFPINNEVITSIIHDDLILNNKDIFYPKIVLNEIKFVKSNNLNNFSRGKFNIMEPTGNEYLALDDIDLFVLPSVGIGNQGKRLGYGGGFYDRLLSLTKKEKICSLIYDFQIVDSFFGENHDIAVSKIFTEKRILYFN